MPSYLREEIPPELQRDQRRTQIAEESGEFSFRVYEAVSRIPAGCVATYGQIARLAGSPRAARAVGNALHRNPEPDRIPCFRVVDSAGRLTGAFAFGGMDRQRELLVEDGVAVVNYRVDLERFQWRDGDEDPRRGEDEWI